tara:strand:- start:1610 stop:2734 length:1125 start_codon:yes stop_codon:yes gene_type:complete
MSFDFTLPKSHITEEFLKLSTENKIKTIELGLCLFNKGINMMQTMNNVEWQNIQSELEIRHGEETSNLLKQISREKTLKQQLDADYKVQLNQVSDQIRNVCAVAHKTEIELIKKENTELRQELRQSRNEITTIRTSAIEDVEKKYEQKLEKMEEKMEKQQEKYEQKLEKEREHITEIKKRKNNSTLKGQDGEIETEKSLNLLFPKAEIINQSKEAGRGDFTLLENDINMMIEVKNYDKNVNKTEINKFHRDMKNNEEYTCGVLLSLKSGICNKKDFSFEFINERPVIYLHRFNDDKKKIQYAFNLFKIILSIENLDMRNQEIIETILSTEGEIIKGYSVMRTSINKFQKEFLETMNTQEEKIKKIFFLINKKNT